MNVADLERALDDAFDHAVVYHGFTDYMRDYEVIVYMTAAPSTGIAPAHVRYLFRYCVEADCRTTVRPEVWRDSLDDRLTDHETGADLDGYVWGVKWHGLHPGGRLVPDSPRTQAWTRAIGIDFHEVCLTTNAHELTLVFSDLQVSKLDSGYAAWSVD
jgi:hypothetical protein